MSENLIGQTLLNQFRVDSFVASGGMGAVYRVWDLQRNVPLAMKVLHADLSDDPILYRRFEREARALRKLAHPHIVPFYGLYDEEGLLFLLERFIEGQSLKDILRQRKGQPFSPQEVLPFLKALCSALGYAHANGVVHCDVKPGNVMVETSGAIYLTDFGVARHAESTTTTFGGAGTPAYMAPEQIRGEAVSPATDIYALGVMLFELLSGQRPFRGDASDSSGGSTAGERIRQAHLKQDPPDPRNINPNLSRELAGLILKCLAKRPQDRYLSAAELFSAACQAAGVSADQVPVLTSPPSVQGFQPAINKIEPVVPPSTIMQSQKRKHPLLSFGLGGVILFSFGGIFLLAMGLLLFNSQNSTSAPPVITTVAPVGITNTWTFEPSYTPTLENITLTVTPTETVTVTPSFTATTPPPPVVEQPSGKIVYRCGNQKDERQICMIHADGSNEQCLTCDLLVGSNNNYPSLSPDGKKVVFSSGPTGKWKIYELTLSDRSLRKLTFDDISSWEPVVSPDGTQILFTRKVDGENELWLMDRDGGNLRRLYSDACAGAWSADGEEVLFRDQQLKFYILNLQSKTTTLVAHMPPEPGRSDWFSPEQMIVTYSGSQEQNGEIYLVTGNGKEYQRISKPGGNSGSPCFSPDGRWVAFSSSYADSKTLEESNVYIVRSHGNEPLRLTYLFKYNSQPRWGP